MTAVLDSSAVLAILFEEPGREKVLDVLEDCIVSSVNLAEVVTKLVEAGYTDEQAERSVDAFLPLVEGLDASMAVEAGLLRRSTMDRGLSLGDRCCLATAMKTGATTLTADKAWADLDLPCKVELIR